MTRNLLLFLLALSVLFNVFFAVGYLQARAEASLAGSPARLEQRVKRELDLDGEQSALFTRLRSGMEEEDALFHQEFAAIQQELTAELARQDPDAERVESILERQDDLRRRRRMAASERFRAFMEVLSPEQRMRFVESMRRERGHRHHRDRLRRFDENGDGQLDAVERERAREHMEARRQMRERRRAEGMKRFDENGNGSLEPDELAAFKAWMRQHRENGPPRDRRRDGG